MIRRRSLSSLLPALLTVIIVRAVADTTTSPPPLVILDAPKSYAPNVPSPINRTFPARLRLTINATILRAKLSPEYDFEFWAYDNHVPGPFVRARAGDILDVEFTNAPSSDVAHSIDFHAASGPGGGASILQAEPGQTTHASLRLLYPGLFIYHCGVNPAAHHVTNGLYGLILVEPPEGLPPVDREYYVMRSEFYTKSDNNTSLLKPNYEDGLDERPSHVVFNGRTDSMTSADSCLNATTDERVRIYFGNAGPNQIASYHVIGVIFDRVYREGDLISPPARGIQTTLVPAGGAAVVEFVSPVPGTFLMVDHSLYRAMKGALGHVRVEGPARLDVYCPAKLAAGNNGSISGNNNCSSVESRYKNNNLNFPPTPTQSPDDQGGKEYVTTHKADTKNEWQKLAPSPSKSLGTSRCSTFMVENGRISTALISLMIAAFVMLCR